MPTIPDTFNIPWYSDAIITQTSIRLTRRPYDGELVLGNRVLATNIRATTATDTALAAILPGLLDMCKTAAGLTDSVTQVVVAQADPQSILWMTVRAGTTERLVNLTQLLATNPAAAGVYGGFIAYANAK